MDLNIDRNMALYSINDMDRYIKEALEIGIRGGKIDGFLTGAPIGFVVGMAVACSLLAYYDHKKSKKKRRANK